MGEMGCGGWDRTGCMGWGRDVGQSPCSRDLWAQHSLTQPLLPQPGPVLVQASQGCIHTQG